jgi:hypothetical protein
LAYDDPRATDLFRGPAMVDQELDSFPACPATPPQRCEFAGDDWLEISGIQYLGQRFPTFGIRVRREEYIGFLSERETRLPLWVSTVALIQCGYPTAD